MKNRRAVAGALIACSVILVCSTAFGAPEKVARLEVTSSAFRDGQMIPDQYAFNGDNASVPISWAGAPAGTKSFALVCEDPDAPGGTWVHWVLFNLPPDTAALEAGMSRDGTLPEGSAQGINDFKKIGYDGPAPPFGVHRYIFKVYALDTALDLEEGATKNELLSAMGGHVLAEGKVMGRFKKKIDIPADPML